MENPFVSSRLQNGIPEIEFLLTTVVPGFPRCRNNKTSGISAIEIHLQITSYQVVSKDYFLDDDAFRQLVQRVYMSNEQGLDRGLIKFDLGS